MLNACMPRCGSAEISMDTYRAGGGVGCRPSLASAFTTYSTVCFQIEKHSSRFAHATPPCSRIATASRASANVLRSRPAMTFSKLFAGPSTSKP